MAETMRRSNRPPEEESDLRLIVPRHGERVNVIKCGEFQEASFANRWRG